MKAPRKREDTNIYIPNPVPLTDIEGEIIYSETYTTYGMFLDGEYDRWDIVNHWIQFTESLNK